MGRLGVMVFQMDYEIQSCRGGRKKKKKTAIFFKLQASIVRVQWERRRETANASGEVHRDQTLQELIAHGREFRLIIGEMKSHSNRKKL